MIKQAQLGKIDYFINGKNPIKTDAARNYGVFLRPLGHIIYGEEFLEK